MHRAPSRTIAELYRATEHVIGQEEARQRLAVALRRQVLVADGRYTNSAGVLMAGPTGTGKSFLSREMAMRCGLPFAEANATQYSEVGFVGLNLSQAFLPLISAAARMVEAERTQRTYRYETNAPATLLGRDPAVIEEAVRRAEGGILLLDEFDKWLIASEDSTTGRDVGRKLQAELLQILEGSVVYVADKEEELGVEFDTRRVLLLCAGAFVGLSYVVERRLDREGSQYSPESWWEMVEPADFLKLRMIPELVGRLSTTIMFKPLREEHLTRILRTEGGLLDEYRARFAADGCELVVEEAGLNTVAGIALARATGARGLRHLLEKILVPALFAAATRTGPSRVVLTPTAARQGRVEVRAA
jgi:ATP-dependent Clp protease ATP-binding subunit ClpX